jgi:hemolysin III
MRDHLIASGYTLGEEIAHAVTHGLGLLLSIVGLAVLVMTASVRGDAWHVVGCAVFGVTLVLLYAASTLYHSIPHPRAKRVLRQLDHAAIFLLIAGSYTPFTLVNLRGGWGWTLLALVWGLAALGIALQVAKPSRVRRPAVPIYLVMGWLIVIAVEPLVRSLHPEGLVLLILGGVAYTLGVVFFAWRRLPYNHAVWHVFVLAGSACHFSCVFGYVLPSAV